VFPHSSDLQPIPNPTAQQTRIQRSSHVGMPCRLRPTTHSLRSLSSAGGVVLRLVVCGVVLVVSRVVWCCSCCVFVCVTCFLLYPTAQHPNPDGDGHCSAAEEFGVCRYALPPLTRDPFLPYSATDPNCSFACRYALPPLTRDPFLSYSATDPNPALLRM